MKKHLCKIIKNLICFLVVAAVSAGSFCGDCVYAAELESGENIYWESEDGIEDESGEAGEVTEDGSVDEEDSGSSSDDAENADSAETDSETDIESGEASGTDNEESYDSGASYEDTDEDNEEVTSAEETGGEVVTAVEETGSETETPAEETDDEDVTAAEETDDEDVTAAEETDAEDVTTVEETDDEAVTGEEIEAAEDTGTEDEAAPEEVSEADEGTDEEDTSDNDDTVTVYMSEVEEDTVSDEALSYTVTYDDDGTAVIKVSSITALRSALSEAAEKASAKTPYEIIVAAGKYTVNSTLYIPSYTTLTATGAVFTSGSSFSGRLLRTGDSAKACSSAEGYCFTDITINGGTWDKDGHSTSAIQICHAQNVTIKNAVFQNVENGHLMEVAGVSGITIYKCEFKDQILDASSESVKLTYEAIQIDVLQEDHLKGYAQEDLGNEDISITYCTFDNVPRGIGSHTAILNNPTDGLVISHCTFDDIKSAAVQLVAVKNVQITDNTVTDAAGGIYVYTYRIGGTFLGTTLCSSSSLSTARKVYNANLTISGNSIVLNSDDDAYGSSLKDGIMVSGLCLDSATESAMGVGITGNVMPAGNYYIYGVTISGNTIKTTGNGIKLSDARGTTVSGNKIIYTGGNGNAYGILVKNESKGVDKPINITGNSIKNSGSGRFYMGIRVTDSSTAYVISDNTVSGTVSRGISVDDGSKVSTVSGNTVSSAGSTGILIKASTVTTVKENKVTSAGTDGIAVTDGGKSTNIKSNTVTSSNKAGIYINGSTAVNIKSNKITSPGTYGISVYNGGKATSIQSNTISSAGVYGINVDGSTATNIKSNTIKSSADCGINVTRSNSGFSASKVSYISGNKITNAGFNAVAVTSIGCTLTISGNTVSKPVGFCIYLAASTTKYTVKVNSNTLTGKSKSRQGIYAESGKVSVKGNTIKSCRYAVYFASSVKGTIYKNTMSGNAFNKYKIGSKAYGNVGTPTLTISTKTKNSIKLKWTKKSATGYKIYRATSKNGTYTLIKTVSSAKTVSWTNKSLKKSKTYYYRIRAYRKVGNTVIYGSYSSIKSGKTKAA